MAVTDNTAVVEEVHDAWHWKVLLIRENCQNLSLS